MGFQFNLALHVYWIMDCLDQGLNNFKQKYHVRWLFVILWHIVIVSCHLFIYLFIEVVIHLCPHALENKVTKKWQITSHIVYATEYQLHNAALCSTSGNSDSKACQQQLAVFRMRRNRRMGWGKKKIKQVELYNRLMSSSPCEQSLILSSWLGRRKGSWSAWIASHIWGRRSQNLIVD